MVNLTKVAQILLIYAVVTIIKAKRSRKLRGSYKKLLFISLAQILSDFDLFQSCTRFQPQIWLQYLYRPIMAHLNDGREFYLFPGVHQRQRRKALPKELRLLRFNMRYTGWRTSALVLIFGQSRQTVNRDCTFIAQVIVKTLYKKYIHLAVPGTREYSQWLGCGVFAPHFMTTIYAVDMMKIKIYKPRVNQRDYFDGHHHEHNVGFGVMCNGFGGPSLVSAPFPGRIPDGTIWHHMLTYANLDINVLPNHYIIGDRIFRFEPPPMLTAYTGYDEYTPQQLLFNYHQASSRIIIENLFGRFKVLFPIFYLWIWPLEWIDLYVQCGFAMLSIILNHQHPLRAHF